MANYLIIGHHPDGGVIGGKIYAAATSLAAVALAQADTTFWANWSGVERFSFEEIQTAAVLTPDPVGLKNIAAAAVNPATEDTLALLATAMARSSNAYYENQAGTALTNAFVQQAFGFTARKVVLYNDDGANWIEWSWDGLAVAGRLELGDPPFEMDWISRTSIYLRGQAGGESYRVIVL